MDYGDDVKWKDEGEKKILLRSFLFDSHELTV